MRRKSTGQINISNSAIQEYLRRNKINRTFFILNHSVVSCDARYSMLKEKAQLYRNLILNYQSLHENITDDFVKLQMLCLDLLSNIFMLLEDYLGHSHLLRKSLKNFPLQIASMNFGVAKDEIKHLEQLNSKNISNYLLITNVTLSDPKQRQLVKRSLKNLSNDILKRIKNIVRFYHNYERVYIKYKHILPAILGVHHKRYDIRTTSSVATSYIYIRDYFHVKKQKDKFYTYIVLATGLEPLTYYENIIDDIKKVYEIVLLSYLNVMSNLSRSFLIPVTDYVDSKDKAELEGIISDVNTCSVVRPLLRIEFNTVSPLKETLEKHLRKDTIYKLRRDIFSGTK